jgi:cell shape-determining protein MreC
LAIYEDKVVNFTKDQEKVRAQLNNKNTENQVLKQRLESLEQSSIMRESLDEENAELRQQLEVYI